MHRLDDHEIALLLGRWLARWRAEAGVSQRYLAARAGISQGGLSRVERRLQACGARRLGRLIWALDDLSSRAPDRSVPPPPIRPPRADRPLPYEPEELAPLPAREPAHG